jgi:hypothetical protein
MWKEYFTIISRIVVVILFLTGCYKGIVLNEYAAGCFDLMLAWFCEPWEKNERLV